MVPRALVPVVQSLVRDHLKGNRVMKFDRKTLNALSVRLHKKHIGVITRLAGDRQLFAFEQEYVDDEGIRL